MRRVVATVVLLLALYVVLVGALAIFQRRLLYFPDNAIPDAARAGVSGLRVEHLATADGLSLLAWYVPPREPGGFVVLYFHGNGGNIAYRTDRLRAFAAQGWGALLMEYRGYGGNPGSPSEAGFLLDARAAADFLSHNGVAPGKILLWGESLGTGVAVRLATERPVAALLLEAPFTSIAALARRRFPFVPTDLLLRDRFDSRSRIAAVHVPVLVMQGGRDAIVPPAMGRALLEAANPPKRLWLVPEAGHNDLGAAAVAEAARFVHDTLPP